MRLLWKPVLILSLPLLFTLSLRAQDTGQICALAYADSNGDGARAANEPAVSHGVGASLLDSASVTIAAKLLEDSPYAADGLLCFDNLEAGEYLVLLTSAEFAATSDASFEAAVVPGAAPYRFDYGVSGLHSVAPAGGLATVESVDEKAVIGLVFALIGSLLVVFIMLLVGALLYLFYFRRRWSRIQPGRMPPAASLPAILGVPPQSQPAPVVANPLLQRKPVQGSPQLFADDETDKSGANG